MQKVVSAGMVVVHKSRFLLLHYDAGHWDLPKGHVEEQEGLADAALRELEEEAGISDVELVPDFREHIHYFFRQDKKLISKDVFFFLCRAKDDSVVLSEEHRGYEWLPFNEAVKRLTFDTAKDVVRKAQIFLKNEK